MRFYVSFFYGSYTIFELILYPASLHFYPEKMQQEIGDFAFCFPLSESNDRQVFCAQSKLAPIPVAIKIISKYNKTTANNSNCNYYDYNYDSCQQNESFGSDETEWCDDQITKEKIGYTVNILKNLNHPNIIKLFDTIEDDNNIYLVEEYADNGNLLNYLHSGYPLSENQAKTFFVQILHALIYLHQDAKVVHRDIKAENILLDSNFHIKIADFGLCCKMNDNKPLKAQCGSLHYVAPEILKNQEYGPEVDIWSTGVLLYFMATGYMPFDVLHDNMNDYRKEVFELFTKILNAPVVFPNHLNISENLKDLILRMLEKDPEQRITLDEIISHPWITNSMHIAKKSVSLPSLSKEFQNDFSMNANLELEKLGVNPFDLIRKYGPESKSYKTLMSILNRRIEDRQIKTRKNGRKISKMGKEFSLSNLITTPLPVPRRKLLSKSLFPSTISNTEMENF